MVFANIPGRTQVIERQASAYGFEVDGGSHEVVLGPESDPKDEIDLQ
jgi:hypothetical protein